MTLAQVTDGVDGSKGDDGTSITIIKQTIKYQEGNSGTEKPTGTWLMAIPNVSNGNYL